MKTEEWSVCWAIAGDCDGDESFVRMQRQISEGASQSGAAEMFTTQRGSKETDGDKGERSKESLFEKE